MKKIILLFILLIAISSCSNDDTNAVISPFEGKWLVYKISTMIGDEIPSTDIWYVFNSNAYTVKIDQEMQDYGIFTFETDLYNSSYHYINLNSDQNNRNDVFYDAKFENGEILTLFDRDESTLFLERVK